MDDLSLGLLVQCSLCPLRDEEVELHGRMHILVKQGLVNQSHFDYERREYFITSTGKRYLIDNLDRLICVVGIFTDVIDYLFSSLDAAHLARFLAHDHPAIRGIASRYVPI